MLSEVPRRDGAAVVRAYGLDDTIHARVTGAIERRYDAEVKAHLRAATLWPMSSVSCALTLSVGGGGRAVRAGGADVRHGDRVPFLGDVSWCVRGSARDLAETQTAIAGWRVAVLDLPVEIEKPTDEGAPCPRTAPST
jgi:hypothetical protein